MPDEISLENVLKRCGDFGRYQWIHYIFLNLITLGSGITGFYYVFGVAEPSFRCRLPSSVWPHDDRFESINATHQFLVDAWLLSTSKCDGVNGSLCTDFVYDRSVFGRTFTEDAKFVCGNAVKRTWLSTSVQIGAGSVLLIGPIGDKIGRRTMIQVLTIGLVVTTTLTQLLLQFVKMNVDIKFVLLIINQLLKSIDAYSMVFLLLMELTSSSHTSLAGNLAAISYTLGEVLVTIFAHVARDWLKLKWLITGYFVLILPYLYFVPESPYWLFNKKKYHELEACLRNIATTNGHLDTQWFPHYVHLIGNPNLAITNTRPIKQTYKEKIVRFLPRLSVGGVIAFVTTLLYVKISYGLGAMNNTISPYWNIVIGAVIESISYITVSILITTRLGRNYTLILGALLTAICVLVTPFIMKLYPIVTIVISQTGKFAISGTLSIAWIYVPELFPTSMRGLAIAVFVFVGRFGAILAPIIDAALGDNSIKITFYVYAALALVVVGFVSFLPETRNRSFDDGELRGDIIQTDASGEGKYDIALVHLGAN